MSLVLFVSQVMFLHLLLPFLLHNEVTLSLFLVRVRTEKQWHHATTAAHYHEHMFSKPAAHVVKECNGMHYINSSSKLEEVPEGRRSLLTQNSYLPFGSNDYYLSPLWVERFLLISHSLDNYSQSEFT